MSQHIWRKSSRCQEGDACVHIFVTRETILLADSATPDPSSIISAGRDAFTNLIQMLKADEWTCVDDRRDQLPCLVRQLTGCSSRSSTPSIKGP
ncbi:DUF397 domain-containing protein [Streptomyces sp. SID12501]|uniref:DUF397 domain-containing protein n=1 Tax=Streptomyces sp. SID12501 TaxID=2706042 RepID=A0A6B3BQ67_9ACTN|nr:DUF397 domain-containing protein [Streptomyces sp. SID12501]